MNENELDVCLPFALRREIIGRNITIRPIVLPGFDRVLNRKVVVDGDRVGVAGELVVNKGRYIFLDLLPSHLRKFLRYCIKMR